MGDDAKEKGRADVELSQNRSILGVSQCTVLQYISRRLQWTSWSKVSESVCQPPTCFWHLQQINKYVLLTTSPSRPVKIKSSLSFLVVVIMYSKHHTLFMNMKWTLVCILSVTKQYWTQTVFHSKVGVFLILTVRFVLSQNCTAEDLPLDIIHSVLNAASDSCTFYPIPFARGFWLLGFVGVCDSLVIDETLSHIFFWVDSSGLGRMVMVLREYGNISPSCWFNFFSKWGFFHTALTMLALDSIPMRSVWVSFRTDAYVL